MKEQADFQVGSAQVVHQLTLGGLGETCSRLDLDDECLVHDHVNALESNLLGLVGDTHGVLS